MSSVERLNQFLNNARYWEKKATSVPGLFLLKLPGSRGSSPFVVIEINPVDTLGSPTKKRGVVVRSSAELEWIKYALSNPKVVELAEKIDQINPEKKESSSRISDDDVFEV
jgi:hypothetical protein